MSQFERLLENFYLQVDSEEIEILLSSSPSNLEKQHRFIKFISKLVYFIASALRDGVHQSEEIRDDFKAFVSLILSILYFIGFFLILVLFFILPFTSPLLGIATFVIVAVVTIRYLIIKKRFISILQAIEEVVLTIKTIVRGLYYEQEGNNQALNSLRESADSAHRRIDLNKEEFIEQLEPVSKRTFSLLKDLEVAIECNRTCKLPEAQNRISYLETQTKHLPLFLKQITGEVNDSLRQEFDKIQQVKTANLTLDTSFDTIAREIKKIDNKTKQISTSWIQKVDQLESQQFRFIAGDFKTMRNLVLEAEEVYQEIKDFGSRIKSFEQERYIDWWKERLTQFNNGLEGLLERPHHTGAGFFGGRNIEWGEWPRHTVCVGATRAGKSLTIEMLMYPVLIAIKNVCKEQRRKRPLRAFIFDVDGTTIPQLERIGFQPGEYIILNPVDSRRWGWATGKDIVSSDDILAFVEVLLPSEKMKQGDLAYWGPLARHLLQETIEYLIDTLDTEWTLWDIFKIIYYDEQQRESLFQHHPHLREELYLNVNQPNYKHFRTVLNTIRSELGEIEGMAALWHETSKKVSIREFLSSSGVLVIPEHGVKAKDSLRKINSFIIELVSKFSIDEGLLPNEQQPNTWIVVDEATRIAPIPRFDDFLTNGLKRGISVIFGFQSYSKAQQEFGENDLEAILEQCTMTALLRLDAKSAEWASEKCRSYWGEIRSITLSKGLEKGKSKQKTTGESQQNTEGTSFQETEGTSRQTTKGGSRQVTKGTSTQTTKGGSNQRTQGGSDTNTRGTSSQRSQGGSDTNTQGTSNQNTKGSSSQRTQGGGTGQGEQGVWGWFGFKSPEGWNNSSGQNWSNSSGTNQSQSTGTNSSQARATNWGTTQGTNSGTSTGTNWSDSTGTNWSNSTGTNESVAEGTNWSETEGTNQSVTKGTNSSTARGTNTSETVGENESESSNIAVQISPQKIARIEPEEFAHFPEVSPTTGMTGVFLMRDMKTKAQVLATKMTLDWQLVASALVAEGELDDEADGDEFGSSDPFRIHPQYTREVLKRLREKPFQE